MSQLDRISRAVVAFLTHSVDCLAPYTVRNSSFATLHHAWSFRSALTWVACYDAEEFGTTTVYDFHGEPIAAKG